MEECILMAKKVRQVKILFLLLFSALFWNCAESTMEFGDISLTTESTAINIDKLLVDSTPVNLRYATVIISSNSYGKNLLNHVKKKISGSKIYFVMMLDANGYPMEGVKMGYAGYGKIYYSYLVLRYVYIDELLFHELFHICQNGLASPKRSLTNEIEAYVAQYLYAWSKGGNEHAILVNGLFTKEISDMAFCIDTKTGQLKSGTDRTEFFRNYKKVMAELQKDPYYADYINDYQENGFPFPNLVKLFNRR